MAAKLLSNYDQGNYVQKQNGGIRHLSLSNFRNYTKLELSFDDRPVVVVGHNGAGKTNLLEAVSLLSSGRGLRGAKLPHLTNQYSGSNWVISCELQDNVGFDFHVGTALARTATGADKRIVRVNKDSIKNQHELAEWLSVVWITPYMDQVFNEGISSKRKFIDRLIQAIYPDHASQVYRYEHLLRERMHVLKSARQSKEWLNALEMKIASAGIAISITRQQFVSQLNDMQLMDTAFPQFIARMEGYLENWQQDMPALLAEEKFQAALAQNRSADSENHSTLYGAHKSNLAIRHKNKDCSVELCSTGEQKMLLLAIILAFMRLQMLQTGVERPHLLLLDDVVTHLDEQHRMVLFREILALKAQVWLTGAQEDDFSGMAEVTQWFTVDQGIITQH